MALVGDAREPGVHGVRARLEVIHAEIRRLRESAPSLEQTAVLSSLEELDDQIVQTLAHIDEVTLMDGHEPRLTHRERQVVMLIGRGYTNEQIAAELHVVKGTVATHIQHLLTKLNCTSRVQVATWAAARGLLDGSRHPSEARSAKSTHM